MRNLPVLKATTYPCCNPEMSYKRIKKTELTEKLNISVDESLHADYVRLKREYSVDMPEQVRRVVKREIARLKKLVGI